MDFFEQQELARRNTGRLILLFSLALLGVLLAVSALALAIAALLAQRGPPAEFALDPRILLGVIAATLLIVGGAALIKITQLRAGGRVVAESLGGRLLSHSTTDPDERRILNVVEEMAIASGLPTPPVYLMENEEGVNAFAAGFTPADAVIGVTRGCAVHLSRDELQGVMAHEFSHILSGDMRLNIRLMGLLFGILVLSAIGYYMLRSATYLRPVRRSNSRGADPRIILFLLGGGLLVIGSVGAFFASIIKAAVSRQREFLADASAVQFTRNPSGIAGALKRIGGLAAGSRIDSPSAPDASHMFFGQAISTGFSALFATHPPLPERIRRIDPGWDGRFISPLTPRLQTSDPSRPSRPGVRVATHAPAVFSASSLVGQLTPAHLAHASALLASLDGPLTLAARDPFSSRALICALLLSSNPAVHSKQINSITTLEPPLAAETLRLLPFLRDLDSPPRLALAELASPTLNQMPSSHFAAFRRLMRSLVDADGSLSIFEWSLGRVLAQRLDAHFQKPRPDRLRVAPLTSLGAPIASILSALAYVGARNQADADTAFSLAAAHLPDLPSLALAPPGRLTHADLDHATDALTNAAPHAKRAIVEAAALAISADRRITPQEFEILRALTAAMDCPTPPLLPGRIPGPDATTR